MQYPSTRTGKLIADINRSKPCYSVLTSKTFMSSTSTTSSDNRGRSDIEGVRAV